MVSWFKSDETWGTFPALIPARTCSEAIVLGGCGYRKAFQQDFGAYGRLARVCFCPRTLRTAKVKQKIMEKGASFFCTEQQVCTKPWFKRDLRVVCGVLSASSHLPSSPGSSVHSSKAASAWLTRSRARHTHAHIRVVC